MTGQEKMIMQLLNEVQQLKRLLGGDVPAQKIEQEQESFRDYAIYEVARLCGRGDKWVKDLIDRGFLKARKYPTGELRVAHGELRRFMDKLDAGKQEEKRTKKREEMRYQGEGETPVMRAAKEAIRNFQAGVQQ